MEHTPTKKCEYCENGTHHPTEHMERVDIRALGPGAVVFVRALVADVHINNSTTSIAVHQYEPYGGHKWAAQNVNSVDVYETDVGQHALTAENAALRKALDKFFSWLDEGLLVRDITKDAQSDWALRMMHFVKDLGEARAALAKAETNLIESRAEEAYAETGKRLEE